MAPKPSPHAFPLVVQNVSFAYGRKAVLRDVSFSVPRGSVYGLFGPNGSGKSTLFRCCLNLLTPQNGAVFIDGENAAALGASRLARVAAYVPQESRPSFPFLVRDIVAMGRTPHMNGSPRLCAGDKAAVENALDLVGITDIADEPCTTLSGGQRQLTSLARALAQETPLMLLDEPTSALDFSNQTLVWSALRRIAGQGVTILVCCHDPNHILWFCDHVTVLRNGAVAASGPSGETLTSQVLNDLYGQNVSIVSEKERSFAYIHIENAKNSL